MEIRTFEELTAPDERTLAFTPLGLSTMGSLRPEDAAEFQQQVVAHCDLHDDVAEGTRNSFERLRKLHSYGVLCYEAFTVAEDLAWLLLEQALRERFIEFHGGLIKLVRKATGEERALTASTFAAVDDAFHYGGSHSRQGPWLLPLSDGGSMEFRGGMAQLQEWARREHLLDGQRNKRLDPVNVAMRNNVAHPRYHLVGPPDSARTIRDLAEIINRLWGHLTPGGRLYPAPLEREVLVVAWTDDGGRTYTRLRGSQLEGFKDPGGWTCIVVRGVEGDDRIWEFDAQYERTNFPAELLWGPGSREDALVWLMEAQPKTDTVPYLDRLFALRIHDGRVSMPRRPEVALALPPERQTGRWLLVQADFPMDAFAHGRHLKDGVPCGGSRSIMRHLKTDVTARSLPPPSCAVEDMFDGSFDEMVIALARHGVTTSGALGGVRVPSRFPGGDAPDVEGD